MSNQKGPIILIDDDQDECDLVIEAFSELKIEVKVRCFSRANDALEYLKTTRDQPFLIFSDMNMPGMSGLELRRRINEDDELRRKAIPFIFLTTTAAPNSVKEAYEMSVQGIFEKPVIMKEVMNLLKEIYDYWQRCKRPVLTKT